MGNEWRGESVPLHVRQFPLPERRCFAGRIGLEFRRPWTRGAETLSGFALSTANALKKLSLTTSTLIDTPFLFFFFLFFSFPFCSFLFPPSRHKKTRGVAQELVSRAFSHDGGGGNLNILKLTPRGDYICLLGGGGVGDLFGTERGLILLPAN